VVVFQNLDIVRADEEGTARWVWPGATTTARWLCERDSSWLRDKHVLELGSGTGLLGLVAARLGAASVTLTDLPSELPLLLANAAKRDSKNSSPVFVKPLAWGDDEGLRNILHAMRTVKETHITIVDEEFDEEFAGSVGDDDDTEGSSSGGTEVARRRARDASAKPKTEKTFDVVLCCDAVYQNDEDAQRGLARTMYGALVGASRGSHETEGTARGKSRRKKKKKRAVVAYQFRENVLADAAFFQEVHLLFADQERHETGDEDLWLMEYQTPSS
jgi:predicted nicotinamide N-methyase